MQPATKIVNIGGVLPEVEIRSANKDANRQGINHQ
jgi:hypothetical protein